MWGLCDLAQCTWCRLGEAEDSAPHRHSNGAQNTLGDQYGMYMPEWVAWCVVFSGSWSKLGVCKKCCKLSKFLPMPNANPTIPQWIACLCEDLLLRQPRVEQCIWMR